MKESNAAIPSMFTTLRYKDARKAIQWLLKAFGLEPGFVTPTEGDLVGHAEMFYGAGGIMFGSEKENDDPLGTVNQAQCAGIYMIVEDVDSHYARAIAAGAGIAMDIYDTDYGSREYTARDFEGHLWSFGNYRPERPTAS
jgi:uncharacterized glyoxalase superfamily protein PhnB